MSSGNLWSGEGYAPMGMIIETPPPPPNWEAKIKTKPLILSGVRKEELVDLRQIRESEYKEKEISKEQVLKNREYELDKRIRKIQKDKTVFIRKFVVLYYYYLKLKNVDKNKGFYKIKLGPYTLKRSVKFGDYRDLNHSLTIYNKKKILFKVRDKWYNKFDDFVIVKFESEAVFELEAFYNLLIDVINDELRKKEETLDNIDLTNISLKELI